MNLSTPILTSLSLISIAITVFFVIFRFLFSEIPFSKIKKYFTLVITNTTAIALIELVFFNRLQWFILLLNITIIVLWYRITDKMSR